MTLTKLESLAWQVGIIVPTDPQSHQVYVNIPIWLLQEIRAELTNRGIDWRDTAKRFRQKIKEKAP